MNAVGVDIGGTKISAAVVDQTGTIVSEATNKTPSEPKEAVEAILGTIRAAIDATEVSPEVIGIGAAGLVDFHAGVVRYAPNLSYRQVPLASLASAEFGVPTVLDNDATCAGYAEYRVGAGRKSAAMVMVTVGTGIGGGLILDGRIFRGVNGFAAEIGHFSLDPEGPLCGCGMRGCWETLASGSALGRLAREAAARGEADKVLELAGSIEAIRGEHVSAAAGEGDPEAIDLLVTLGRNLGRGLSGLANIFDPDRFVIGGGLSRVREHFLDTAAAVLSAEVEGRGFRPEIPLVSAALFDKAGVIGAALLALEECAE